MGRDRLSIARKKVTGAIRKDREPKVQSLKSAIPKMPSLTKGAKKYYHMIASRLEKIGTLSEVDDLSLVLMAESYSTFMRASKFLEENDYTYEFTNKAGDLVIRSRPEVKIAGDSWSRLFQMFRQYGLTNVSRNNIVQAPDKEELSEWDNL